MEQTLDRRTHAFFFFDARESNKRGSLEQ